jgi:FAD/FMN-containing dehydrogenase
MEMYVPRSGLVSFIERARQGLREIGADVIYGTIRLIEKDDETFNPWARESFACIVLNLHAPHTPEGLADVEQAFRMLIDIACLLGGGYSLTYHRFATRKQIEAAFPNFVALLRRKRQYDPNEVFQSNWYRHYSAIFADALA